MYVGPNELFLSLHASVYISLSYRFMYANVDTAVFVASQPRELFYYSSATIAHTINLFPIGIDRMTVNEREKQRYIALNIGYKNFCKTKLRIQFIVSILL